MKIREPERDAKGRVIPGAFRERVVEAAEAGDAWRERGRETSGSWQGQTGLRRGWVGRRFGNRYLGTDSEVEQYLDLEGRDRAIAALRPELQESTLANIVETERQLKRPLTEDELAATWGSLRWKPN
jgi:hypothetical protein